jgi:Ser/Thr protein kinase RdoA (MazF antagonist)
MQPPITDDIEVALRALREYDIAPDSSLRLLNLSENATYLVDDAATGAQSILRVHRQNYHEADEIESELDWLAALERDSTVRVPTVISARDGRRVVTVDVVGTARHVVHFDMVAGAEPDETRVTSDDFRTLGQITAALHDHARSWSRPSRFRRFSWHWGHCVGDRPRWGRWQDAAGVTEHERRILGAAEDLLRLHLLNYGDSAERFGLIHADLRLANLLVAPPDITVIDFDDCGFGWFFYDFGAAVSFLENDPALPEWQASWTEGYRSRLPLAPEDEDMLTSFVFLRRLMLLAWLGSHSHSKESASKAVTFAEGSCELAERYLTSNGRSLTR